MRKALPFDWSVWWLLYYVQNGHDVKMTKTKRDIHNHLLKGSSVHIIYVSTTKFDHSRSAAFCAAICGYSH